MGETTGISWCDSTFNPWVGCSKVSPGCAHCYAEELVTGRMGRGGTWGEDGVRERTSVANWRKPLAWERGAPAFHVETGQKEGLGRRRRVFCASLADVFEPRPELEEWRRDLFDLIAATPSLDWQLLTKRPEEARDWLREWFENDDGGELFGRLWATRDGLGWGVLPNVWIGASVENARHTWRADVLREIPAAVRFISAEPLLGSLYDSADERAASQSAERGLARLHADGGSADQAPGMGARTRAPLNLTGIDWLIVGGESGGRDSRPMLPSWPRELRDGRDEATFFFKQWGSWTPDEFGRDPNAVWVSPDGRSRSRLAADAYDDLPNGSMRMRYAGPYPHSGGKHLDGREWAEFPSRHLAPTPVGGGTK